MARVVEPLANISAPDLLGLVPALFGWVRREDNTNTGLRSVVRPLVEMKWPWYYMILRTGCLYLFKKADSSNFSEVIPLTKYRVCDAQDVSKYSWVFKLVHITEVKTVFFAVDTEYDLKKWKDAITNDKEEFCSTQEEGHNYCDIDDPPTPTEKPLPPLPSSTVRQRPPAPLPEPPGRPHSLSLQNALQPYSISESSPLVAPKQHNYPGQPGKKPTTLPRPSPGPAERPLPKPPVKAPLTRRTTDSCLAAKAGVGFDFVVQQLKDDSGLGFIHEGDNEPAPMVPQRPSATLPSKTRGRGLPDGCEGQKGRITEVTPTRESFPNIAFHDDMTKETASSCLKSQRMGTYLTRSSDEAESKKSLSVRDQNDNGSPIVRHYRIFYNQSLGYALDTRGPRFESVSKTLEYYYDNALPNTKGKLRYPYVKTK